MISLFGKSNESASTRQGPRERLAVAAVWCLVAVLFLATSYARVAHMEATGRYVSPWRFAQICFWAVILLFWTWNVWSNFKRDRAAKASEKDLG